MNFLEKHLVKVNLKDRERPLENNDSITKNDITFYSTITTQSNLTSRIHLWGNGILFKNNRT